MVRPNGHPVDETGSAAASSNVSVEDAEVTITRIVDICLGLDLSLAVNSIVTNAWKTMNDYEHSLNQSVAYIRQTPLFLDIELKKTNQSRDPQVQLAIWMAGLYEKRRYHKWDTSIPMSGLIVNGSEWLFYVAFVRDGGLIMMGPQRFGSTVDASGTFEVIYKLNILVQLGVHEYRRWFGKFILGSLAGQPR
ncbi:hypothetical protein XANCAGTX0491_006796 [Xanthoria calcicola]